MSLQKNIITLIRLSQITFTMLHYWTMTVLSFATATAFFQIPSAVTYLQCAAFVLLQYGLYVYVPGRVYRGPADENGDQVSYANNGLAAFVATSFLVLLFGSDVRESWQEIITIGNVGGVLAVAWLNYPIYTIQEWYVGKDLHPTDANNVDWKLFIASRVSMMGWAMAALLVFIHSLTPVTRLSALLQYVYLARFFYWESGYVYSMDQQHDRAGFYICWGCLSFVPMVYWLPLVTEPTRTLSAMPITLILAAGLLFQFLVYDVDRQKHAVKMNTPSLRIWGATPKLLIHPTTGSKLLYSGWWGTARHVHYIFELLAAFCWCAPVGGAAYLYFVYLTVLLVHRCFRDDQRCKEKYGETWDKYCSLVPYRMIPYIF